LSLSFVELTAAKATLLFCKWRDCSQLLIFKNKLGKSSFSVPIDALFDRPSPDDYTFLKGSYEASVSVRSVRSITIQ